MDQNQLLVLTVLLLSMSQTEAEVVQSVSDCDQFFLDETPPQIPGVLEGGQILNQNRYKPICQMYNNNRTFFTLYDTTNKIPVFSAYKFIEDGKDSRTERPNWMVEPELENTKNMASPGWYKNQASDYNYKDNNQTSYDRGHLYPSSYGSTQIDKNSTCTLTNIVPQAKTFNQGSWNKMETCVKCVLEKYCINNNNIIEGFLVTGAEPGNQLLNETVNIPKQMWSAFCCYSEKEKSWLASAHWGDNVPDTNQYMETKTLNELYLQFSRNTAFELFPQSQCPTSTTVTRLYPSLKKTCMCPKTLPTTATPTTTPEVTSTRQSPTTVLPTVTTLWPGSSSAAPYSLRTVAHIQRLCLRRASQGLDWSGHPVEYIPHYRKNHRFLHSREEFSRGLAQFDELYQACLQRFLKRARRVRPAGHHKEFTSFVSTSIRSG